MITLKQHWHLIRSRGIQQTQNIYIYLISFEKGWSQTEEGLFFTGLAMPWRITRQRMGLSSMETGMEHPSSLTKWGGSEIINRDAYL